MITAQTAVSATPHVSYDLNLLETLNPESLSTLASDQGFAETLVVGEGGLEFRARPAQGPSATGAAITLDAASLSRSFGRSMFTLSASHPEAPPSPSASEVGAATLGSRFDVQRALGVGTYGEVWSARDLDLGRAVALKRFKGAPEQALSACRDELRFVGRLEHPGMPPVYQAGLTEEGQPYVVMKLLEGEPLSALIARLKSGDLLAHAAFPFSRRVELILQLLRVVGAAHAARVLHRDIKPDNIYLGRFGEVSLIDWGIAEDFEVAQRAPKICGTPLYLSPEQGLGRPLGPESDLYAVGAVAYELLTLESAAPQGETVLEILRALPTHSPVRLNLVHSPHQGTPSAQYAGPVMRALSRNPEDRFRSAEEMAQALQGAIEGYCDVSCPRTFLKRMIFEFSHWIDQRRHMNTMITYVTILLGIYGLMRLGSFLGI